MYFEFTDEEKREQEALKAAYDKLFKEDEAKIDALRPDDPEPDPVRLEQIQKQRKQKPKRNQKAIVEWEEAEAKLNEEARKVVDEWYSAGSAEWHAARAAYFERQAEYVKKCDELFEKAKKRYLAGFGNDPEKLYEDACAQIEALIKRHYFEYEKDSKNGATWRAYDVRVQKDGSYRLDTEETRKRILTDLEPFFAALSGVDGYVDRITVYLDQALKMSPYVSSEGDIFGEVTIREEKSLTVVRPKNYKRPNNKSHNLLFKDELTTTNSNHFEPVGLNRQKSVVVYANFVPPAAAEAFGLDDYDERVYAAVGSCLLAGNTFIPLSMLYNRGMMGLSPNTRGKDLTPAIERDILKSLAMFDGRVTLTNDPTGEHDDDPNFESMLISEPLLFYQYREEKVHGQLTKGILIPSNYVPVGYRIAEANNNELLTDRIESIHVEGLNYSRDNVIIANATYKEVKRIQYDNNKKRYSHEIPENKRTITYALIAERMKRDFDTMSPTERNRLKGKIDACMKSYQASRLFDRYEHKRDATKSFYAVVLYFDEVKKIT